MPTILDFQIQPLSAESYSLTVRERSSSQPLASATFSHRVDFLTDFSVDRLNASTKDAAERFDELQKLGRELYQKLFSPTVEQVWNEYKQRSEFLILCLRFAEGATKLEVLPWETLHDGAEFIAAGAKTTLTRLPLDVAPPSHLPPIPRPLKLFGFFASPLDLQDHERLNAEREQEILLEAINDPAGQGRISADFEDEAKLEILARSLRDGYHILHFTGHGISPRDGGGLLLEDAHGKKLHASIAEVMQAVESGVGVLRLAVISGCQTARTLHTGAFSDLARELLRQRVPAVIAMQFSISDEGGLKFAEALYKEIAKGIELERAVHAARRVLLEYRSGKPSDFSINSDALAIVLLAADGACLQTTEAQSPTPQAEPGATYLGDRLDPLAHGFYGRRREYREIRDALLHQDQRAFIIHGIGGIGKTALLTHAINRLRPRFKDVMSFDCRRAALAPETILLELHRYFATQGMPQLQSLIGQNVPPETLADEIARMLTEWPLLIVFDNFESQLDERREFINEDLRVFLATLVRATVKGSRFLFTTRYLFDLDGERLGNLQELPLGDLSRPESLMLMQKLPNLGQAAHRDKLAVLEKFGGHPYALVALDQHCNFRKLSDALHDARALHKVLREFLAIEINYERLSNDARELLNGLAAFRRPEPIEAAEWVARERDNLYRAIEELIEWGLLTPHMDEGRAETLFVHNLVRDFCCEQLAGEHWLSCLRNAAAFYTNLTKLTKQDDKSQTAVWGEMEAFELLMEAKDFEKAAKIMIVAHENMDRWGIHRYVESQCHRLLRKTSQHTAAKISNILGITYWRQGKYELALEQLQYSLKIKEGIGDQEEIAVSQQNIGAVYWSIGKYDLAMKHFQYSLSINEQLGDRRSVAGLSHNIGVIHWSRGQHDLALEQYQRALRIAEDINDLHLIASSLHEIGKIHLARGEYELALEQYQRSLNITEELNDRNMIAASIHQVGRIYAELGKLDLALEQYQRSCRITEEIGDRANLARSLHQIGDIFRLQGEFDSALQHFYLALKIKEEIGDLAGVGTSLHQIGLIYQDQAQYGAALKVYQRSLKIDEELGNSAGVARSKGQIGQLLTQVSRYPEAFKFLLSALLTLMKLGLPDAGVVANLLVDLRSNWGEKNFDEAWQRVVGGKVPDWLTQ